MTIRHAGFPENYLVPSISTSGHISHSTDSVSLSVQGRNYVSVAVDDQTLLTGTISCLITNSSGGTELRGFWDGNRATAQAPFPNGLGTAERAVSGAISLNPGDQTATVFVNSFTSASGSGPLFVLTAGNQDSSAVNLVFGLDGGNPSGATSESPGSLSVGGKDIANKYIHRTAAYDSGGRTITRPWGLGDWTAYGVSAATAGVAVRAAGGVGVRHVCTGLMATISVGTVAAATASPVVALALFDGAANVVFGTSMSCPAAAGSFTQLVLPDLNIRGSTNTVMTLLFATASGTSFNQSVAMFGSDITE